MVGVNAEIKREQTIKKPVIGRGPTGHPFSAIHFLGEFSALSLPSAPNRFSNYFNSILNLIRLKDADSSSLNPRDYDIRKQNATLSGKPNMLGFDGEGPGSLHF